MKIYITVFTVLMLVFLFVGGCTSGTTYEQPAQITTKPTIDIYKTRTHTSTPTLTQASVVKTFSVGETASNGKTAVTLNNKRFADKITYSSSTSINGQSYTTNMDFKPGQGKQFLILDITVENLQKDITEHSSVILQFRVNDADGYSYDYSMYSVYLDKKFAGGDLLPGQKMRGEAAFEVPINPNGIQFAYKFDLLGQTAVFNL